MAFNVSNSSRHSNVSKTQELIECVRKCELLYNRKAKGYKDHGLRASMWQAIGESLGMTASDSERKWRVQRDRYNKERKRVKESLENEEIYTPSWELYTLMDDVLSGGFNHTEITITNVVSLNDVINGPSICEIRDACNDVSLPNDTAIEPDVPSSVNTSPVCKRKRLLEPSGHLSVQSTGSRLNKYSNEASNVDLPDADDEIELFCNLLKAKLKKLDVRDQILTMREIDTVVFEKTTQDKYFL